MKIEKYKKKSNGRYEVTFDDQNKLLLYEEVIIKNELLLKKEIDISTLDSIIKSNNLYEAYDKALSSIEKKLKTEKEIDKLLSDLGCDKDTISYVINKLKEEKYLDENRYIESFTHDKINLTMWGPYKISRSLIDLGIDEDAVYSYIKSIDENIWKDRVTKLINKKALTIKNKSKMYIKNKINAYLFDLGYDKDDISIVLDSLNIDDKESLKKEMSKAYDKYSKKYEGEELKRQIKNYLYRKGYGVNSLDFDL